MGPIRIVYPGSGCWAEAVFPDGHREPLFPPPWRDQTERHLLKDSYRFACDLWERRLELGYYPEEPLGWSRAGGLELGKNPPTRPPSQDQGRRPPMS
jgi:hypothetical protein